MKIAVQLYSVREEMQKDFAGTLEAVAKMGYDGVEFAGLFGHSADEVKALCEKLGLDPISAHVPLADMIANTEEIMATYAAIGCRFIVIPHMTVEYMPTKSQANVLEENMERISAAAKKTGMQLLYHNHDFEFFKIGDEWGMDVLYSTYSADCLQTEIDTCWVNVAGVNPAEYVRKYTGRAPIVHLKDFYREGQIQGQLFELIGVEGKKPEEKNKTFEFRPLGKGCQDVPELLRAAADAGAGWVVVEQDRPSMGLTPMECIKVSVEYLKTLA